MSTIIKSFSVGDGDMYYIDHMSDNFTMIDIDLPNDDREKKEEIISEIKSLHKSSGIVRFISTHPDQDHICGLKELDEEIGIVNFYCVKNDVLKKDETDDFKHYRKLKNDTKKSFYLYKGCARKWMNQGCDERGSAGINILWPKVENRYFKEALTSAESGESPNNISPIVRYSMNDGATFLWMGDLETDFMENIVDDVELSKVNVLFAPHHGRDSGKIPQKWLEQMDPDIIIIGEAPSDNLNYYNGYNTITQNSAKNIIFYLGNGVVNIYVESSEYSVDFLTDNQLEGSGEDDENYIGTLEL